MPFLIVWDVGTRSRPGHHPRPTRPALLGGCPDTEFPLCFLMGHGVPEAAALAFFFTSRLFTEYGRGDLKLFYLPNVESLSSVKISPEAKHHEHTCNPDTLKAAKGKDGELKASLGYTARHPPPISLLTPAPPHTSGSGMHLV